MNATGAELKSLVAKQKTVIAQQRKEFQATAAHQQEEIKALTARLKEQASQIQLQHLPQFQLQHLPRRRHLPRLQLRRQHLLLQWQNRQAVCDCQQFHRELE